MKLIASISCFVLLFLTSHDSFARSLKASADKLAQDASRLAVPIGLFGLIVASIYLMLGRNDASEKMTKVLMGLGVCMTSGAIISFFQGLA